MSKREFQEGDKVRVYGAAALTHVNGGGMRLQREFRNATVMRRDEQHGRGQWRVLYDGGLPDVVAEARLELDADQEDAA